MQVLGVFALSFMVVATLILGAVGVIWSFISLADSDLPAWVKVTVFILSFIVLISMIVTGAIMGTVQQ